MKNLVSLILILILIFISFSCSESDEVRTVSKVELDSLLAFKKLTMVKIEVNEDKALIKFSGDYQVYKCDFETREEFVQYITPHVKEQGNDVDFIVNKKDSFWGLQILLLGVLIYLLVVTFVIIGLAKRKFNNPVDKIFWLITVLFLPAIGIVLYAVVGNKKGSAF